MDCIEENGKIVKCPECGSTKIKAVDNFDYIKMCMNDKCLYKLKQAEITGWRYQFWTGVHN